MRIAPILFAIVGASSFAACGDDPVKPGELVVKWSAGPSGLGATCGSFSVTNLEARAMKGDDEIASVSGACPTASSSGTLTIPEIAPGTYSIEVEASNAAGRATYLGTLARQNVSEGKTVETPTIELKLKPASIGIDWRLPNNDRCATAGIAELEFSLYYNASTAPTLVGTPKKVACDSEGFDFADLVPNADVKVIAFGLDAADKKVATATTEFFPLDAGAQLEKVLTFATCPGTPPVCP